MFFFQHHVTVSSRLVLNRAFESASENLSSSLLHMVFFVLFLFLISVLTTPGFAQTVYQETDAWQISAIGSGEQFDSCLAVNRFDPYSLEFRYAENGDISLDLTGSVPPVWIVQGQSS